MESADSGGAAGRRDGVDKITINIGATSYSLGDLEPIRALGAVNPEYFSEGEGADFVAFIHEQSTTLGLSIENERPVVGMWQGNLEPAMSVDVVGPPAQVERLAKLLGRRYNQESVMLFQPDPKGRGNLYGIADVSLEEADMVFGEMLRQGLPGGRYVDGRIEIVDVAGESGSSLRALADLLGKKVRTTAGHTRFLSKGEGDY